MDSKTSYFADIQYYSDIRRQHDSKLIKNELWTIYTLFLYYTKERQNFTFHDIFLEYIFPKTIFLNNKFSETTFARMTFSQKKIYRNICPKKKLNIKISLRNFMTGWCYDQVLLMPSFADVVCSMRFIYSGGKLIPNEVGISRWSGLAFASSRWLSTNVRAFEVVIYAEQFIWTFSS